MLRDRLGKELLFFDGGMGTLLQEKGLQPGELPEVWNLEHAEEVMHGTGFLQGLHCNRSGSARIHYPDVRQDGGGHSSTG